MVTLDKPRDSDIHSLADFAEILCLVTIDRICSRESIRDQIRDVGDSRVDDDELEDCFNHLTWRQNAFGEHYPFEISAAERTLRANEELTQQQKLYTLLLLCSNLPYFERGSYAQLTNAFERVSLATMQKIFPATATSRAFGKVEGTYTGTKWERMNQLAKDIVGYGACDANTFRRNDSGDGGVDIVAWLSLDNYEASNKPSALAQCACSREDWPAKQTEISVARLGRCINATTPWMELLFIPHSFRNNHGRWAVPGEIGMQILIDRLRITTQIGSNIDWNEINPPIILDEFLEERLDLV
jgi:hypothetical protein